MRRLRCSLVLLSQPGHVTPDGWNARAMQLARNRRAADCDRNGVQGRVAGPSSREEGRKVGRVRTMVLGRLSAKAQGCGAGQWVG
jgi:hypothetical protein